MNLKDLDLKLLVVFEAIYTTGNISHAAEKLAMSQPAVSNQLARLRELLDDPLFARGRRGVEPTVKALAMIGPVREALGLIGRQFGDADELVGAAIYLISPSASYTSGETVIVDGGFLTKGV